MSTQAEGNWETKKPPRNRETEKLEIARHFKMGLFTKEARQCNDMRGVFPLWCCHSHPPPSFQGQKNRGFLACYGWRSAMLLHYYTSFLSDHILSLLSFFSFDVIIPQIFIKTYYLQGNPTSPFWRRSALGFLWKERCSSWNSSTLATSCEELIHWKRLWCWEGLGAGGEGDNRGWDGWMTSLTRWTWVWVNSGSLWWTGRPGVLRFMGSQRVGHDWATDLIWSDVPDSPLGITVNKTNCGLLSHVLHCRGIRSHMDKSVYLIISSASGSQVHLKMSWGNFLATQWLRLSAFTPGAWVQPLVKELRSHNHVVWPKKGEKKSWLLLRSDIQIS